MKEVNKICLTVFLCFLVWQANDVIQISHKRAKLNECYKITNENYFKNWDSACRVAGKKNNCTLPTFQARDVDEIRTTNINQCIEIFKYNK